MRIITGEYKGRRLYAPDNDDIRPTSDKVKEALFSMIAFDLEEAVCVDLFAGTGNLGLEALSRGAGKCYFCDNSKEALNIIRKNIAYCGAEHRSAVLPGDFRKGIGRIKEKADFIFADPPYDSGLYDKIFETVEETGLLKDDGLIIAEHWHTMEMADKICGFVKVKERKYGHIILSIYRHG